MKMWGRGWSGDTREGSLLKVINKLVGEPGADLGLLGLAGVGDVLISFLDFRHLCLFFPLPSKWNLLLFAELLPF